MLKNALRQAKTIAIGGHVRPDGDCFGSCMGLYQYIRTWYPDVKVDIYLEELPDSFGLFAAANEIQHEVTEAKNYELFISLDCADKGRLGFSECLFDTAKNTLCIDHHISNPAFAEKNYIDPEASSTSELVYRLIDKEKITAGIAEFLYLGIVHDTGVFQYSCTSPETMEAAAQLMRSGIRASEIIDKTFYEKTYAQNKVLGRALESSELLMDGKCIVSYITQETMGAYNVKPKDLEGIVSQLRVTQGVEVAIFLYEQAPLEYKISLRASGDVDVSKVAGYFGGGGHKKAAGARMTGKPEDIIDAVTQQIRVQM